ncbi:MAG: rod shape-determining protein MreC [Bacteroidetes bacterium 4572_117]|nr:MAG: rod shape-determining protein MreC [Bacteroidetes bacterium 4572_117]
MKALINVIIRFHFVLLFIVLEIISIRMVVFEDIEKKNAFYSSANSVSGFFYNKFNTWIAYFSLASENELLRNENLELRSQANIKQIPRTTFKPDSIILDSVGYSYTAARVINNSIYRKQNYITIDKGYLDGIKKESGVISSQGMVGVVVDVSKHYSLIVSILNNRFGVGAKIKKNNQFGSVGWNKNDYRFVNLMEIPNHISISKGDTIVSNGFSAIFPPDINIGTISKINTNLSNNFYEIEVNLSTDFKSLYNVYVIDNFGKAEQRKLEKDIYNEY